MATVKPGESIQKVLDSTTDDVVVIREGVYPEMIDVPSGKTVKNHEGEEVIIDGRYQLPPGDFHDTRINPTDPSLGAVFSGLVRCIGVRNVRVEGLKLRRSRGRGFIAEGKPGNEVENITVKDLDVAHCREAAVRTNRGVNIHYDGIVARDCGNYMPAGDRRGATWPMIVSIGLSRGGLIENCTVSECWGEPIGAGYSWDMVLRDNTVWDSHALLLYLNMVEKAEVSGNLLYHTGNALFLRGQDQLIPEGGVGNNEMRKVQEPPLKNVDFHHNIIVGARNGFAIWRKAEEAEGVLTGVKIHHNTIVNPVGFGLNLANIPVQDAAVYRNAILGTPKAVYQIPQQYGPRENYVDNDRYDIDVVGGQLTREMFRPSLEAPWIGYGALEPVVPPQPKPDPWLERCPDDIRERIALVRENNYGTDGFYLSERAIQFMAHLLDEKEI